ncbi:MAG: hypothetical protein V3S06_05700 [candidate division Zixibacteria bacterium]
MNRSGGMLWRSLSMLNPSDKACHPSESKARVLEVEFADGEKVIIPRANVEMMER